MKARNVAVCLAISSMTMCAAAQEQPVSSKGHWHVDFERSSDPWGPHPRSVSLYVAIDDETNYEATETIVGRDGAVRAETIRAAYDGKPYPVQGSPHKLTVAMTHLASGASRIELSTRDGLRGLIICGLSADRNTMICDETDADAKGISTPARSVYVRD